VQEPRCTASAAPTTRSTCCSTKPVPWSSTRSTWPGTGAGPAPAPSSARGRGAARPRARRRGPRGTRSRGRGGPRPGRAAGPHPGGPLVGTTGSGFRASACSAVREQLRVQRPRPGLRAARVAPPLLLLLSRRRHPPLWWDAQEGPVEHCEGGLGWSPGTLAGSGAALRAPPGAAVRCKDIIEAVVALAETVRALPGAARRGSTWMGG